MGLMSEVGGMNTTEMSQFLLQVLTNKYLCMMPSLFIIGDIFQTETFHFFKQICWDAIRN
jgi:hypothetical protein